MLRLWFWWFLAWPSYELYKLGMPTAYGWVSAKYMRALIDVSK